MECAQGHVNFSTQLPGPLRYCSGHYSSRPRYYELHDYLVASKASQCCSCRVACQSRAPFWCSSGRGLSHEFVCNWLNILLQFWILLNIISPFIVVRKCTILGRHHLEGLSCITRENCHPSAILFHLFPPCTSIGIPFLPPWSSI